MSKVHLALKKAEKEKREGQVVTGKDRVEAKENLPEQP